MKLGMGIDLPSPFCHRKSTVQTEETQMKALEDLSGKRMSLWSQLNSFLLRIRNGTDANSSSHINNGLMFEKEFNRIQIYD